MKYKILPMGRAAQLGTELWAERFGIESRLGQNFPPVETGPGAHPASFKMGTGSFSGVEVAGAWALPPLHPSAEGPRKE